MSKAYPGHIIIKNKGEKDYRNFYGPADKGSAKPSFCYPSRKTFFVEEIDSLEKALENGHVDEANRHDLQFKLKQRKQRLETINEGEDKAMKFLNEDKDYWANRRGELAAEISNSMPSRQTVKEGRANPRTILKNEKGGLGEMKKEYIVISRALGEESDVSYLQK